MSKLKNIKDSKRTTLHLKETKDKRICQFNWKCKSRSSLVFKQLENGRTPNDLFVCETHAREMKDALMKYFNEEAIPVVEEELLNSAKTIELLHKVIERHQKLLTMILEAPEKKAKWSMIEELLKERRLEWKGLANISKGAEMYVYHELDAEDRRRIKVEDHAAEVKKKAEEELAAIEQSEMDALEKLLEDAAREEGVE